MPTFLTLLGVTVPASVQGRLLQEALVDTRGAREAPAMRNAEHTARTPDGRYAVTGRLSVVRVGSREYRYVDGTTVTRK